MRAIHKVIMLALCAVMLSPHWMCCHLNAAYTYAQGRVPLAASAPNFLTGTYREILSQDRELGKRVMAATAGLDSDEAQRQGRALMRILHAPPLFAIEQYGTTITMNYPGGTRVPYEADGKSRVFRATGGESVTVRAELGDHTLTIDLTWSGGQRLHMIYESAQGGVRLVYTRGSVNSSLNGPVTITSEYERISQKATRSFAGLSTH